MIDTFCTELILLILNTVIKKNKDILKLNLMTLSNSYLTKNGTGKKLFLVFC
jgi:hypothetical protein